MKWNNILPSRTKPDEYAQQMMHRAGYIAFCTMFVCGAIALIAAGLFTGGSSERNTIMMYVMLAIFPATLVFVVMLNKWNVNTALHEKQFVVPRKQRFIFYGMKAIVTAVSFALTWYASDHYIFKYWDVSAGVITGILTGILFALTNLIADLYRDNKLQKQLTLEKTNNATN